MDVYNDSAVKVGSYYFDVDYTDIFFEEDGMVIYNESECQIFTTEGVEKIPGELWQERAAYASGRRILQILPGDG